MNSYVYIIIIILLIILIIIILHLSAQYKIYNYANILNKIFIKYCHDPAVFDPTKFNWTSNFRKNYDRIRGEYLMYSQNHYIPNHNQINKYVASCDTTNSWKTLYLRAYNKNTHIAKYFPITMKLINLCPCTLAFFSILKPGAKLSPHVGIYKGVIRYHLSLIVPKEWNKCYININGIILNWIEGSDIMFDDMFPHYVENNTNETRVILFLDIKRDFHNIFLNCINTFFLNYVKSNDILNNTINNVNKYLD